MKPRRQQAIRRLVSSRSVHSQHELQSLLRNEGFEATQATLSRDLAELGVLKGPDGYRLPGSDGAVASPTRLEQALRRELLSVACGGTLVVLKTPSGHGNALAVELDAARLTGALGTIAGDDTIYIAATGPSAARRIATQLGRLAGIHGSGARTPESRGTMSPAPGLAGAALHHAGSGMHGAASPLTESASPAHGEPGSHPNGSPGSGTSAGSANGSHGTSSRANGRNSRSGRRSGGRSNAGSNSGSNSGPNSGLNSQGQRSRGRSSDRLLSDHSD